MALNWAGVYPAITTKFTKDDELDLPLFQKNLEAQRAAGVLGVVIGGSLGEASTLTMEEKEALTRTALQQGGLNVLVNIAEGATRDAVAAAKKAESWGAHGLMLLPPMRYKCTDAEMIAFFKAVAEATPLPIMLYNNPVDYRLMITLDMFEQLVPVTTIEAVKESTRDVTNVTRLRNRFGDRFKILCGVDTLTFEELAAGADGLVAGLVCAFPQETVAIYKLIKAGNYEAALNIYRWFMPLLEFDIDPQLVQYIKLCEVYTGIGSEQVRLPRLPLTGKRREAAIAIIETALANRPVLSA